MERKNEEAYMIAIRSITQPEQTDNYLPNRVLNMADTPRF
jgi:hypothetical protein